MAGIYIHIPYCKQRCSYCDFHFKISQKDRPEIIKSIKTELLENINYFNNKEVKTIYFGGGTPSIINEKELEELIILIYQNFKIKKNVEITVECNPEDITTNKIVSYKKMGINRLSIGVQSFNNSELKFMNRPHDAEKAYTSITTAQQNGFENISIDLIYGLPNQKIDALRRNLSIINELKIKHFAAYSLTIEKKTKLFHLINKKQINPLQDHKVIEQFNLIENFSKENKYIHYEISNFAKEGFLAKHNSAYWENKMYLGVGPSAHSFDGKRRKWNVSSNKKYIEGINNKSINYFAIEYLSKKQHYNEYLMTNFRTIWGVDTKTIERRFGKTYKEKFLKAIKKWLNKNYIINEKSIFKLSSKGKIFADRISSDMFLIS
tara:strand:+ start:12299 stop:13432 length:1134 start_codon:yes stop_codon:yes gene_type:complete